MEMIGHFRNHEKRTSSMLKSAFRMVGLIVLFTLLGLGATGCYWARSDQSAESQEAQRERDEKTRDQVARATEKMKPAIETAGRKLGEATEKAAEQAHAAVQGVQEGWQRGSHAPLDVNAATERELTELPGISAPEARKIIHNRPYSDRHELLSKGVLTRDSYDRIKDDITAK
jgi:DNA uptake protein ComE-like DNA-binding protein